MFENLSERFTGIVKRLRGEARLTESNIDETLQEVRLALLEADVALPVVKDFVDRVRARALGQEVIGTLTPGQALIRVDVKHGLWLLVAAAAALWLSGWMGARAANGTLRHLVDERS